MRSASIFPTVIFTATTLLFSAPALPAQSSVAPTIYNVPPASQGCPVSYSVNRVGTPGVTEAGTDPQAAQQMQKINALHLLLLQTQLKRSELAAKLAQTPAADTAAIAQLGDQIKALDAELDAKQAELKQLNETLKQNSRDELLNPHGAPLLGQSVQISFRNSPAAIVAADVIAHGISAEAHIVPAVRFASASDLTESFHLVGSAGTPLLQSSVRTTHPMMITWIELTRIEYANGTVWQQSSTSRCAAAPSLFVLVNAGQ